MNNNDQNFWPSYVDIMTSLFFVVLVLFVISYRLYTKEAEERQNEIERLKVSAAESEKIKEIHSTLEALLQDTTFFIYEEDYKRYRLAQEVQFKIEEFEIENEKVFNYAETKNQLIQTGIRLRNILDALLKKKNDTQADSTYQNLSYTMVISGRASQDGPTDENYILSYNRAYHLYKFWQNEVADFDSDKYRDIVDLQISGVGEGGVGRFLNDEKNRSFFIQIIPKIGELKKE